MFIIVQFAKHSRQLSLHLTDVRDECVEMDILIRSEVNLVTRLPIISIYI